jgi:hypothetical protein
MKWAYDLTGAEPIIKDIMVYDGTTIAQGEMTQLGTANYTAGTNAGIAFITCGPATAGASTVVDGLGICMETVTTASGTSIAAVSSTLGGAVPYAKHIINPFAVYRAAVETGSTANTGAFAIAAGVSGSTVAAITVTSSFTSTATGNFQGQWVIFTASAGPSYGTIRRIQASGASAGSADLDVLLSVAPTTADKVVLLTQPGGKPNCLSVDGIKIGMNLAGSAANLTAGLRVVQNYIDRSMGLEILTPLVHANGSAAAGRVNTMSKAVPLAVFQDIMIRDHVWGVDL